MVHSDGVHLLLDGATATPLPAARVKRFLFHFPRLIGVRRITEPVVVTQNGGVCGIVVIAASHISVHTQGIRVWVDCFSCLGFNEEATESGIERLLGLVHWQTKLIPRPMPAAASWTAAGAF